MKVNICAKRKIKVLFFKKKNIIKKSVCVIMKWFEMRFRCRMILCFRLVAWEFDSKDNDVNHSFTNTNSLRLKLSGMLMLMSLRIIIIVSYKK